MGPTNYSTTKLKVPKDFPALLEGLAIEVLRHQPKDIVKFASNHFTQLLEARTHTPSNPEHAAVTIQKNYRGYIERKKFTEQKKAAETIKKRYHEHYMKRSQSAAKIQLRYRGFKSRKPEKEVEEVLTRADELGLEASATKIQAAYRGYKTRKELQSKKPDSREIKQFLDDVEKAAIIIQKNYKGYITRKKMHDHV